MSVEFFCSVIPDSPVVVSDSGVSVSNLFSFWFAVFHVFNSHTSYIKKIAANVSYGLGSTLS
jgi:hypothetical protein